MLILGLILGDTFDILFIEPKWVLFNKLQVEYPSGFYDSGSHFSEFFGLLNSYSC